MGSSIRADYTSDRHANATYVAFAEPHVTSCFLRYACAHTHAPREATMGCRLGHQLRKRCSSTRSFHRTLRGLVAYCCFPNACHGRTRRAVHARSMHGHAGGGRRRAHVPGRGPSRHPPTRRPQRRVQEQGSASGGSRCGDSREPLLRRTMRMPALTR